jgi:Spy/CpxP family protein refolding chaperone
MKKLLAFVLALLAFGFAETVSAQTQPTPAQQKQIQQAMEKQLQEMKKELGLNNKQVNDLRALSTDVFNRMMKASQSKKQPAEMQKEMMALQTEAEGKMKKILTPAQYKKYQEIQQKKIREATNRMRQQQSKGN